MARFLCCLVHFCLLWNKGKYSLDHRFQKMSERYWTCLHLRRDKQSSSRNNPGGIWGADRKRSRWLGVKASGSRASVETVVRGRPFIILSTSQRRVVRLSSSMVCVWSRAWSVFRVVRIQRSQTPPKCEPYGGLKIHLMFFWSKASWILLWFHPLIASLSSLCPPVKLVALGTDH